MKPAPALLALALLLAPSVYAQYAIRADVVGAGASDAAGGGYTLLGTVAEPASSRLSGSSYTLGQGFWYPATLGAGFALSVTATPLNPPIVIPASGGAFRFRVRITNHTGTSQTFQVWIDVVLPSGNPYHVLGPQRLTLGPNETFGPVTLRQQVPGSAPPGGYVHRVHLGSFGDAPLATGSFPWTKAASEVVASLVSGSARRGASAMAGAARSGGRVFHRRAPGWLVLLDATGATVGEEADLTVAMPIDEAAEARITAAEEAPAEETTDGTRDPQASATPSVSGDGTATPSVVVLAAPYPNPSADQAAVRFGLPEPGPVRIAVYDVLGRRVAVLLDDVREAGWHSAALDGSALPAGTYSVRLEVGGEVRTRWITRVR
jgi:hypothetical protein